MKIFIMKDEKALLPPEPQGREPLANKDLKTSLNSAQTKKKRANPPQKGHVPRISQQAR